LHESERGDTVGRIAREGDPDRALAVLFAPGDARADLLTLVAFNVELARIAAQVNEPGLGAIRLQWWREAVEHAAKGEATGHPVADALGAAILGRGLTRDRIAAMIDARRFDIETRVMPDWPALETYLDATAGNLFALGTECLGKGDAARAASKAGIAYGLTGLMRAVPVHALGGRVYLPADALRRHGTSPEAVLAGKSGPGLLAVLAELRGKAKTALGEARSDVAKLGLRSQAAFRPLSLVDPYIASLEKAGRDPLREIAGCNPLYRLWRMTSWRG
jgi:phytoene synthase